MIGGCDDPSSRARLERELPARAGPMRRPLAPAPSRSTSCSTLRVEAGLAPSTLVAMVAIWRSTARWLGPRHGELV